MLHSYSSNPFKSQQRLALGRCMCTCQVPGQSGSPTSPCPLYLSMPLYISLDVSLSSIDALHVSFYLSISTYLSIPLYISLYLSIPPYTSLHLFLSLYTSLHLYLYRDDVCRCSGRFRVLDVSVHVLPAGQHDL